jgi:hypothetical protein
VRYNIKNDASSVVVKSCAGHTVNVHFWDPSSRSSNGGSGGSISQPPLISMLEKASTAQDVQESTETFYYHSTTWSSATNILFEGARRSGSCTDFCRSGAYYFNVNWREAVNRAIGLSQPLSAIMVYKFRRDDKNFGSKPKNFTKQDLTEWRDYVQKCRKGINTLKDYTHIYGMQAQFTKTGKVIVRDNSMQFAIVNDCGIPMVDKSLICVIFLKNKAQYIDQVSQSVYRVSDDTSTTPSSSIVSNDMRMIKYIEAGPLIRIPKTSIKEARLLSWKIPPAIVTNNLYGFSKWEPGSYRRWIILRK